ncbi:MAG: nucleotide exchange factor GrpE [Rickettsiales bacterium]
MTNTHDKKHHSLDEIKNEEMEKLAEVLKEAQLSEENYSQNQGKETVDELKLANLKLSEENDQLKDQLIRSVADSDNLRKRVSKQVEDASKFAINKFSKDLIDVLENLYLATSNISQEQINESEVFSSVVKGVEMTKSTLISVFDKYGIKRIEPKIGEAFDHNFHEAVSHIEHNDFSANAIIDVMRCGYTLNDRLLKPAMVVVAKASSN